MEIEEMPEPAPKQIKKSRGVRWFEAEEVTLIEEVLERESILFGDLKGVGVKSIGRRRSDAWAEIAGILSVRFANAQRTADEVKKKYFNLKQRAKEKIDRQRKSRQETGGGPAMPDLSLAEETLVKSLEGRPVAHGLCQGIDTDDDGMQAASSSQDPSACTSQAPSTQPQAPSTSDNVEILTVAETCGRNYDSNEQRKKRRKMMEQSAATLENTIKDTERIIAETNKHKLEIEKLKLEINYLTQQNSTHKSLQDMAEMVKVYYQLKMQHNFQVVFKTPEQ